MNGNHSSLNGNHSNTGRTMSPDYDDESLNYANFFNYKDQTQDLTSLNPPERIPYKCSSSNQSSGIESSDDNDSDDVLKYISQMLMEEDMDEKSCMFHDPLALQVAEKPFYDILGKKYPPHNPSLDSPDDHSWVTSTTSNLGGSNCSSLGLNNNNNNNILSEDSMMQFQKGVEEASKFLPKNTFPNEKNLGGSKIHYRDDEDFEDSRTSKQSAVSFEEVELSEMFDRVLLCNPIKHEARCMMGLGLKNHGKKQGNVKNTVDLWNLLILCAQSTASEDRKTADELLMQVREHCTPFGDGSQRLAHYFANSLEARLAGTGPQIYTALSSKRTTAADMIKPYQFFLRVCPFKKISIIFAISMILKAAENASKLHVIDFGILYGFQRPVLIQRLSERQGGPPKLCITGIDLPQPGFRPAERVEATGRRLAKYCERFNVPFEYRAIAQKWETIKLEDLKITENEVVAVNCLFRFKNLLDETIMVDSPRNAVLNLIKTVKPDIFVHGVVNGSYGAPFFVTRFREAIFHYSTVFDMFDANAPRDDPERLMFEKEFYGREVMNVVACEGTERVERPETYKQWQARLSRVGFRRVPLDRELVSKFKSKVKTHYPKDFIVDVDGHWMLQGWKGRILCAISAWVP